MTPKRLVSEIQLYCRDHADPVQAKRYARFFTEGYDAWGLDKDHEFWNAKQQEWLARFHGLGIAGFIQAGEMLLASGKYEEGSMAIRFLIELRPQLDGSIIDGLDRYFRAGIGNWAHTDVLCRELIGPLLADGRLTLEAIAPWRASPLKFQRRAVPVGLLERKAPPPVAPQLEFLRPLMLDQERVVQQGLGWCLREAWKLDPQPVERFLHEWKDTAPRLIFQYATEKMTKEARERFRRVRH